MVEVSPSFLLSNPAVVEPAAPWCVVLDNLESAILLLAQPWVAGGGQRRADLERRLAGLAAEMPLGAVYFQRVNRAVARLERAGALRGMGTGRSRRFAVTPRGFAALILNLRILSADPTIDGSEFEFKRALVAMWNLVLERVLEWSEDLAIDDETARFFDEVEALRVLGAPVITEDLLRSALDVVGLIELQREHVLGRQAETERRLARVVERTRLLPELDRPRGAERRSASSPVDEAELLALARGLAAGALPKLNLAARVLRYRQYLDYLDRLAKLHTRQLKVVDLNSLRRLAARRGA